MIKLLPLLEDILREAEQDSNSADETHILSEKGYNFLKGKIEELNHKAEKWGVPPMELVVIKEEFKPKYLITGIEGKELFSDTPPTTGQSYQKVTVKEYTVRIDGEPPRVEGYEFIAKIEHTEAGNILNYAPKASEKNIPNEYRTATQACDVCHTLRDRNNTFILKLEKDDPNRFVTKKAGDFVMVGSGCLKRFLPGISASALMSYAEMIESIRASIDLAEEMNDRGEGGGGRRGGYTSQNELSTWLAAQYLSTGKFFSKKKAEELGITPSLSDALSAMYSKTDQYEDELHKRMRTDDAFKQKVETFVEEFLQWVKTKDLASLEQQKPDFRDYFHNLDIVRKQEYLKDNHFGLFSGLFQLYLRDLGDIEKQAAQKKASEGFTYLGKVGEKVKMKIKVKKLSEYTSTYGPGVRVAMEGESTELDPTTGQSVNKKGMLTYFTGNFELEEGEEAEVEATVKKQEPNKFTQQPETIITRVKILNFITHPEKNAGMDKIKEISGEYDLSAVQGNVMNKTTRQWEDGYYITLYHYDENDQRDYSLKYVTQDATIFETFKKFAHHVVEAKSKLKRAVKKADFIGDFEVTQIDILKDLGEKKYGN